MAEPQVQTGGNQQEQDQQQQEYQGYYDPEGYYHDGEHYYYPPTKARKIIIIGASVAGLTLALTLKRLIAHYNETFSTKGNDTNTQSPLPLEVVIYDARTDMNEYFEPHYMLWKYAVKELVQLGLGKRLGKIGWPVVNFKSIDCVSGEDLVSWPPSSPNHLGNSTETLSRSKPHHGSTSSLSERLGKLGVKTDRSKSPSRNQSSTQATNVNIPPTEDLDDVEAGGRSPISDALSDPFAYLPPLLACRKVDLVRMLMTALAGRDDLLYADELVLKGANNSDLSFFQQQHHQSPLSDISTGDHSGIGGDMARGNWFKDEGFEELLPNIKLGYKLESLMISATYGSVTVRFENGYVDHGCIVVGADGVDSTVRDLIFNSRVPAQHAKACHIHGMTRVYYPPVDCPTELPDGRSLLDVKRDKILDFCPDGLAKTYIDRGLAFGTVNLGNGLIGWNLVAHQAEKTQLINEYIIPKRRAEIGQTIAKIGKGPGTIGKILTTAPNLQRESVNSTTDWKVPSSQGSSTSSLDPPVTSEQEGVNEQQENKSAPSNPTRRPSTVNWDVSKSKRHPNDSPGVFVLASPQVSKAVLPPALDTDILTGDDARTLALSLANRFTPNKLPIEAFATIARTDLNSTVAADSADTGDVQIDHCIARNFHPGRVILIGDAAHAPAPGAHGSVGASLAIADAVTLGLFLSHYLRHVPLDLPDESLADILEKMGTEYDSFRTPVGNQCVLDARAETTWVRTEEGIWKNLVKMSRAWNVDTWARVDYETMLTRGQVELPERIERPSLKPKQGR